MTPSQLPCCLYFWWVLGAARPVGAGFSFWLLTKVESLLASLNSCCKIWCLVPLQGERVKTGNYLSTEPRSKSRAIREMERNNLTMQRDPERLRNLLRLSINRTWHVVGVQESLADQWMKKQCKNNVQARVLRYTYFLQDILTSWKLLIFLF